MDVATIKVSRRTDTANRLRHGNVVFVAREGADRVQYSKSAGTIIKTYRQRGSKKTMRAPIAPRPEDIPEHFRNLKRGQKLMIRNANARGLTPGATTITDLGAFQTYAAMFRSKFTFWAERKIAREGLNKKAAAREMRRAERKASEIIDSFYSVEIEETDEGDEE
jgi:hypothetical protein